MTLKLLLKRLTHTSCSRNLVNITATYILLFRNSENIVQSKVRRHEQKGALFPADSRYLKSIYSYSYELILILT